MPTVSRACYDYTQGGCLGGLTCFQWYVHTLQSKPCVDRQTDDPVAINSRTSTYGACVTTVLFGGSNTWLNCFTRSTIKTINVAPATAGGSSSPITTGPTTTRPTGTSRSAIGTTTSSYYTPTQTPDKGGISGGAIAGIVIGAFAALTIFAVSLFLCFRKKPTPQQPPPVVPPPQPQPQPTYPGYQQPPYQNDPMAQYPPQPPYSPQPQYYAGAPGMQQVGGYPGVQSPASPVYPEQTKEQPTSFPAELSSHQH